MNDGLLNKAQPAQTLCISPVYCFPLLHCPKLKVSHVACSFTDMQDLACSQFSYGQ